MIKVSVMYPSGPGKNFDLKYFLNSHIPMVRQKLGATLKGASVEQGLAGAEPGSAPPYLAIATLAVRFSGGIPAVVRTTRADNHGRRLKLHQMPSPLSRSARSSCNRAGGSCSRRLQRHARQPNKPLQPTSGLSDGLDSSH